MSGKSGFAIGLGLAGLVAGLFIIMKNDGDMNKAKKDVMKTASKVKKNAKNISKKTDERAERLGEDIADMTEEYADKVIDKAEEFAEKANVQVDKITQ